LFYIININIFILFNFFFFSLFEYYRVGLLTVGPTFIGLENFKAIFTAGDSLGKYFLNTLIMWVMGFVPQIIISLLLAVWFTNTELNLKGQGFFKTVIYMPNLIMAATFAMLFFTLFSPNGPVNGMIRSIVDKTNETALGLGAAGNAQLGENITIWAAFCDSYAGNTAAADY